LRDNVENLARAYLRIRREGCILFDDLYVVIHCNPDEKITTELTFKAIDKVLYGRKKCGTGLDQVNELYFFINNCIEDWRQRLEKFRW